MDIRIDTTGIIIEGDDKGWYVRVEYDSDEIKETNNY